MPLRFLHADMDAFFAAVEQLDHPEWRGKPVVVGSPPDRRGVVSTASYEARRFGIRSAMPAREAGRRCPHAIFVPPNGKRYSELSRQIFSIFRDFTPLVEPVSIDEAFMDISGATGLFGEPPVIAETIRKTVNEQTGLTVSIGVAPNKFLAKLASDMNKPDGLTIVPCQASEIRSFLAPLPVGRLWGVGRVTTQALSRAGFKTVSDLQAASRESLLQMLGAHGAEHLKRLAFGIDEREITMETPEKSISKEHTFDTDCRDARIIQQVLHDMVEDVGRRLREGKFYASVGRIKLRWNDFRTITRQRQFTIPVRDDFSLRELATNLFVKEPLYRPIRLIGFGVTGLQVSRDEQLDLFGSGVARRQREALSDTIDQVRKQFGPSALKHGSRAAHSQVPKKER